MTTLDFGTGPDFDESPVLRRAKRSALVGRVAIAAFGAAITLCAIVVVLAAAT